MVSRKVIENVIVEVLKNHSYITGKCGHTIAEMHEILSGMSYEDQFNQLKEKGFLNPFEEKDILQTIEDLKAHKEIYEGEKRNGDELGMEVSEQIIQRMEDELFVYGRRLIEGYETEFPVNLDELRDKAGSRDTQFKMWEYDESMSEYTYTYDISYNLGEYEERVIDLQQQSIKVPNYDEEDIPVTDERVISMNNYFSGDINHHQISHEGYLNRLDKETRKHIKNIDSLMDESDGLPYNIVLYRGGTFNIHTRVGETISFKGYTSTTFQHSVAQWYKEDGGFSSNGSTTMTYIIHAPKGTKGIAGNDTRFKNGFEEHEYVLPRNTNMKVINIDYEKGVCEVVIDE